MSKLLELHDDSVIGFGKYKGKTLSEVPDDYLV